MKDVLKKQTLHDEVLELLPWFVNNSLEGQDRSKVMTHLGGCTDCQQERDRLERLQTLVQAEDSEMAEADYKPSFEKLMNRIDANELEKPGQQPPPEMENSQVSLMPVGRFGRSSGWFPYAAAASLVLGIALVILVNRPETVETLNVPTLNSPGLEAGVSRSQRMALTFEENIDSATLRAAFVSTGAYIVSGPDEEGRYVIEIIIDGEQGEDQLIHSMTEVEGVKYASILD